jgi:hypothetical protein
MADTIATFMLKGDSLLNHVNEYMELINRGESTRTEMIKDAGYVYDNGYAMYTQFYTELLNAKGIIPATTSEVEDKEYEDLPVDKRNLYDRIDERLGTKWTHEEIIEFIDELEDIGIDTADQFDEAYAYETDEYHAERVFAEWFVNELEYGLQDSIVYAAIDWQDVWDHQIRYDFNTIEVSNGTFFFRNN